MTDAEKLGLTKEQAEKLAASFFAMRDAGRRAGSVIDVLRRAAQRDGSDG